MQSLLTVKQLSEALNVPVSWIYERTRQGQQGIPHERYGKYIRFDFEKVRERFRNADNQN